MKFFQAAAVLLAMFAALANAEPVPQRKCYSKKFKI